MQGEWSCYRGGHFNGEIMVSYRGSHFYGGRMVTLQKWSL